MRDRSLSVFALSEAHVRDPLRFHLLLRGALPSSPSTAAAVVAALPVASIPVSLCRSIPAWPLPGWEQQGRSEIVHAPTKEVDVVYAVQMYRLVRQTKKKERKNASARNGDREAGGWRWRWRSTPWRPLTF